MRPTFAAFGARVVSQVSVSPQPFKRAQLGLFQGKTKQYGNSVPFSLHKTRRTWLPNVQRKRLFSDALGSHVQVKVTTAALRTIKKKGGVDNYVEQTSSNLLGWRGLKIRLMVREAKKKTATEIADSRESVPKTPARSKKIAPLRVVVSDPTATLKALANPQIAAAFVRYTRRVAAKASGNKGFASARDTIEYLKQKNRKK